MRKDKEALATLLGLGFAGSGLLDSGSTSAAEAGRDSAADANGVAQQTQQAPRTGLVFVNDYQPGVGFQVVSRIQQPTVNQILGYVNPASPDAGDGAVVDPADWNGYIVNYQGCGPGNYDLVFLREGFLESGQTYSFTTDAVFFSNTLQLLEADIRTGTPGEQAPAEGEGEDAAEGEAQGEGETETEETTTEETTTETTEETTTEETTTETTEETTETTTEETTTETTTTTPEDTTTTTTETPTDTTTTTNGTTTTENGTTEQVVVNATETTTEGG